MPAPTPPQPYCSQLEFAGVLNCGKSYVTKLKRQGRLVLNDAGLVDVQASLARIKTSTVATDRAAPAVQGPEFMEAAERDKHYAAELKRLEFETQLGKLRSAAEVAAVVSEAATTIRATVEAWRSRLPPQLAAMGADEQRMGALLAQECDALLHRMADRFAALAERDA